MKQVQDIIEEVQYFFSQGKGVIKIMNVIWMPTLQLKWKKNTVEPKEPLDTV